MRFIAVTGLTALCIGLFAYLGVSRASGLMNVPEFVAALNNYLRLQYEAEFYVRDFENELDLMVAEKEKFPSRELDPLSTRPYAELRRLWPMIVFETDRLAEAYQAFLESGGGEDRLTLSDARRWLTSLTEADQLQILPLLLKLKDISGDHGPFPSWVDQSNLGALFRKNEAEIASKAAAYAGASRRRSERGAIVYPSPDSAGNFTGNLLPENVYVFTFDDGPGNKSTLRLHKVLTEYRDPLHRSGAPATFFVLIERVERAPDVLEATQALGFRINNHSWTHPDFSKIGAAQLRREIVDSTYELKGYLRTSFRFFRCPYGACFAPKVPAARELIAEQGLIHAYWNIDSLDWKNIGHPDRTVSLVIKEMQVRKRGLILMHDIHESTVDAAAGVLKWIRSRNEAGAHLQMLDLENAVDLVNQLGS